MRVILDAGKALACLIFCGLLVLLVPSAAWSEDGETPSSDPSPSSSPAPESASPSVEPAPSDSPSPSPSTSSPGPSEMASPSSEVAPSPGATETVYVVTEPPAPDPTTSSLTAEPGTETVVALSDGDRATLGIIGCLIALGVGARIVGSFA